MGARDEIEDPWMINETGGNKEDLGEKWAALEGFVCYCDDYSIQEICVLVKMSFDALLSSYCTYLRSMRCSRACAHESSWVCNGQSGKKYPARWVSLLITIYLKSQQQWILMNTCSTRFRAFDTEKALFWKSDRFGRWKWIYKIGGCRLVLLPHMGQEGWRRRKTIEGMPLSWLRSLGLLWDALFRWFN